MEYLILKNKLNEKRIDIKTVAMCLGIDDRTVRNKINGENKIGFSWDEANTIHKLFLSEYEPEYLFVRTKKTS